MHFTTQDVREIGRYELSSSGSLPDFSIGIISATFQIDGVSHDIHDGLKSVVWEIFYH